MAGTENITAGSHRPSRAASRRAQPIGPAVTAPAAPDPAVAAWSDAQCARLRWLNACPAGADREEEAALEDAVDAAWELYEAAMARLIAARPTTMSGVLAKVAAAHAGLEHDCEEWSEPLLASLLVLDPRSLAAE